MDLVELARSLNVLEQVDVSDFQRRARILQAIWREEHGFPCGEHRSKSGSRPLGSRLPMPRAKESLANFITARTREVARTEVCDPESHNGKLYGKPRIFNDLLSSQPLCFNLFAELSFDLALASDLVKGLTDGRFCDVRSIAFEHSPGRGDPRYLADLSAFDVFLECSTRTGGRGFVAIEVKYHENLLGPAGRDRPRYDEVAARMGCFSQGAGVALKSSPLQQIWRDHLLAGVMSDADGYDDALFVMLYPRDNMHVSRAVAAYRSHLSDSGSFDDWTLEDVCDRLRQRSQAEWIGVFIDRYLAFNKVTEHLERKHASMAEPGTHLK